MTERGLIEWVETYPPRSFLTADAGVGATVLQVEDAEVFLLPDGVDTGEVSIGGLVYTYSEVVDTDDETVPSTVTLDAALTVAADAGEPVELYPSEPTTWAGVSIAGDDDGDIMTARVDHALLGYTALADGPRDPEARELAILEYREDTELVLVGIDGAVGSLDAGTLDGTIPDATLADTQMKADLDAAAAAIGAAASNASTALSNAAAAVSAADAASDVADAAQLAANQAASDALAASGLAGSKGKVIFSSSAPAAGDQVSQNLWVDTTGGANTPKRWNGSAWIAVTDKVATDAATAAASAAGVANTAATNASSALTAANGKNKVIFSAAAASGTTSGGYTFVDGDVWFQRTAGVIVGQWEFVSGAWAVRTIDNAVIANLNAGKITAGNLDAGAVTIRTAATGPRVELKAAGIIGYDGAGVTKTVIDATTGKITATDVDVTGAIKATSGQISGILDMTGTGVIRTATSGQRVQIGTSGIATYDAANAVTSTLTAGTGGLALAGNLDLSATGVMRTGTGADRVQVSSTGVTLYTDDPVQLQAFPGVTAAAGVAVDSVGNVYAVDSIADTVRKFGPDGTAGLTIPISGDPAGVAVDSSGNIYVTEFPASLVRKFNSAGTPGITFSTVGLPTALAVDTAGNVYVADQTNRLIRKFSSAGVAGITIATTGDPRGVAIDATGNIYVTDGTNSLVRKFNSAGTAGITFSTVGIPLGVAVDSSGNIYVADSSNYMIRKFNSAGAALASWSSTGVPRGLTVDTSRNLYASDFTNGVVRKFNTTGNSIVSAALDATTGRLTAFEAQIGTLSGTVDIPGLVQTATGSAAVAGVAPFAATDVTVSRFGPIKMIQGSFSRASGTSTAFTKCGAVPAEFRPAADLVLAAQPIFSSAPPSPAHMFQFVIRATGDIEVRQYGTNTAALSINATWT